MLGVIRKCLMVETRMKSDVSNAMRRATSRPIAHFLKNDKNKGKEPEKMRCSFNRGMCATWGHSEEEISSSDEEMQKHHFLHGYWRSS